MMMMTNIYMFDLTRFTMKRVNQASAHVGSRTSYQLRIESYVEVGELQRGEHMVQSKGPMLLSGR